MHVEVPFSQMWPEPAGCHEEYRPLIFRGHGLETPKPAGPLIDGPSKPIHVFQHSSCPILMQRNEQ